LHDALMPDRVVYGRAVQVAQRQYDAVDGFDEKLAQYLELQNKVDQTCKFKGHDAKQLKGSDCYELK